MCVNPINQYFNSEYDIKNKMLKVNLKFDNTPREGQQKARKTNVTEKKQIEEHWLASNLKRAP